MDMLHYRMVSFVLVEAETRPVLMDLIDILTMKALKFTVANDVSRLFAYTYSGSTTVNTSLDLLGPSGDLYGMESSVPSEQKLFNRIVKSEFVDDEDSIASPSNTVEWTNSGITSVQSSEEQNEDASKEIINAPSGQCVISVGSELQMGNGSNVFSNLETLAHGLFAERSQSGLHGALGSTRGLKRPWNYGGTVSSCYPGFTYNYMKDEDKEDGKKKNYGK
uniref:Ovule protein n=1 Tax=Heterorhabditis bacteriophora TaxID=37862 RepID=A0A1I7XT22_HETBA